MEEDYTQALLTSQDRVTGLRMGLVEIIAVLWPDWMKSVEAQLGKRLSEIPDNILLSYMSAASSIHTKEAEGSPNDLNELERALRDSGIHVEAGSSHAAMAAAIRTAVATLKSSNAELKKQRNDARKAAKTAKPTDTAKLSWAESSGGGTGKVPFDLGAAKSGSAKQQKLPGVFDIDDMDLDDPVEEKESTPEVVAEAEEILAVPKEILARIRAGVKTTTPRFMSDIVTISDSAELAGIWERNQRRGGGDVSFINAQDKHRSRGALIVPKPPLRDSIPGFSTSPWGRALEFGYRGGRLFDVAAVFRKAVTSIVAVSFKENAVQIIANEAQGHYGIVLALGDSDEWYDTVDLVRELALESDVSKVVVIECVAGSSQAVREALLRSRRERRWRSPVAVMQIPLPTWLASGISSAITVPLG